MSGERESMLQAIRNAVAGGNRGAAGILEHMSRILREIARTAMAAQERGRLTYLATAPAAPVPGAAAFQRA